MKRDILTGRNLFLQSIINLFSKSLRLRFNPRRYAIENFIKNSAGNLPKMSRVLDAGAGPCPYKKFFQNCNYEATDFTKSSDSITFTCSLDKIPKKNNTYDAIICTEVLEHVEFPQKVISEFYRVLKKQGTLFLTTPQQYMLHQEPYNFYYFTKYGLKSLLVHSGFRKMKIKPMGGYFWALADILKFNSVLSQYKRIWVLYYPLRLFDIIFNNIIFPFILFHLDFLDQEKKWTCGYLVEAKKTKLYGGELD